MGKATSKNKTGRLRKNNLDEDESSFLEPISVDENEERSKSRGRLRGTRDQEPNSGSRSVPKRRAIVSSSSATEEKNQVSNRLARVKSRNKKKVGDSIANEDEFESEQE
jgi:hypothetical protein